MSNIAPVSTGSVSPAPQAAAAQPSLASQVAQQVSVAAALESALASTLDNALGADDLGDAATLVQLQVQTQGLSISTAGVAALVASLGDSAKNITRQI